nr:MAG TPA: hypothetical protein [Caudoviricetes sp.]
MLSPIPVSSASSGIVICFSLLICQISTSM